MAPKSPTSVRINAGTFAVVLGLLSVWLIAAQVMRPALPFFPADGDQAKATAMHRAAATAAAWIGWPRGGLWVDYAIAANAELLTNLEDGVTINADDLDKSTSSVTEMAARLAPSDARAWLLLASVNEQSASTRSPALAQLKMSFYTSPYNERLFPLRIQIVARSTATFDDELRSFIDYELGMVLRDKPDLRRSIASAFHVASPAGRQILQTSIAAHDPKFLSELKTTNP